MADIPDLVLEDWLVHIVVQAERNRNSSRSGEESDDLYVKTCQPGRGRRFPTQLSVDESANVSVHVRTGTAMGTLSLGFPKWRDFLGRVQIVTSRLQLSPRSERDRSEETFALEAQEMIA